MILSVDDRPTVSFEALEGVIDTLTRAKGTRVPALVAFDRAGVPCRSCGLQEGASAHQGGQARAV